MASDISLIIDGEEYYMKYDNIERDGVFLIDYERTASNLVNEVMHNEKCDTVSLCGLIRECEDMIFRQILGYAVEYCNNNEIDLI